MLVRHPTTKPTTARRAELARCLRTHREIERRRRRSARKRRRPLGSLPPAPFAWLLASGLSFLTSSWHLSSWPQISPLAKTKFVDHLSLSVGRLRSRDGRNTL